MFNSLRKFAKANSFAKEKKYINNQITSGSNLLEIYYDPDTNIVHERFFDQSQRREIEKKTEFEDYVEKSLKSDINRSIQRIKREVQKKLNNPEALELYIKVVVDEYRTLVEVNNEVLADKREKIVVEYIQKLQDRLKSVLPDKYKSDIELPRKLKSKAGNPNLGIKVDIEALVDEANSLLDQDAEFYGPKRGNPSIPQRIAEELSDRFEYSVTTIRDRFKKKTKIINGRFKLKTPNNT